MIVEGYPNYHIHTNGKVYGPRCNVPLKVDLNSSGYERVTLSRNGIAKRYFVHHLIAKHFIRNTQPHHRKYLNHIDGDRRNNRANNLEWCTASYNVLDGFKRGRLVYNTLGREKYLEIVQFRLASRSTKETAEKYGLHRTTIQDIMRRYTNGLFTEVK